MKSTKIKKKILIILGTRPEAIKMAPLFKEFKKYPKIFTVKLCVTAQHREMLDQVLNFFEINPDYDLDIMKPSQNLSSLTSNIIKKLRPVLEDFKPELVFVHGDTTTTMAASLASFYFGSKTCHIEAGLRTFNKLSPFPEEMNRQIVGKIADYHFAPTQKSYDNLILENVPSKNIIVTGNTVIDALLYSIQRIKKLDTNSIKFLKKVISPNDDLLLVTIHRRENYGKGFENVCEALKKISKLKPQIKIIFPVHLNPKIQDPARSILGGSNNIFLIDPLTYPEFIWIMNRSKIIITDSGGVQEEAPSLGKPVLVLRNVTERPEAVEVGTVILVGSNTNSIVSETLNILSDQSRYKKMSELHNPYGDGKSSSRIVKFIKKSECVR